MKTYDSYKDSGIQWIGEIPEDWEIKKMKYCADLINGYSFKPEQYTNEGIPVVRIGDLDYEVNIENAKKVDFELLENLKDFLIKKGDILLALTGATIGKSALFDKDDLVFLNQRVGILRTKVNVEKQYLRYVIMSNIFREFVDLFCGGSAQENIGKAQLDNYFLQLPRLLEQTAIANYLDAKTTEIDQVVADKEALIVLYEEEKKALINEAVTKGVTLSGVDTSAAKLKPSGIDWLGDIPEHWEVKKIKHTTYLKARVGWKGLRSDEFLDEGFSYLITGTDIKDGKVDFANAYFIDEVRYDDDPFIQLKINDLLITKDGTIGKLAIVDKLDRPACLNSGVFILRAFDKKWQVKFLFFILSSNIFKSFIDYTSYGSTILHLYQNVFNEFQFPLPPVKEQTAIVHHIETETTKINDKINQIKQEIELLKEYRQALIFEAVTGKICVH